MDGPHIAEGLRPLVVPIDSIMPDPANVRLHDERNIGAIKSSLQRYGQRKPIVVNRRTGVVEAGSGTLEAARALGWQHIAVVYVNDDPTTATGYAIADNRTAELADWDDAALAQVLQDLKTAGELEHSGFDEGDLDRLLRDLTPPKPDTFSVSEALNAASELAQRIRSGQRWRLGEHVLVCADCRDQSIVAETLRVMGLAGVDLVVTSPPFNARKQYNLHDDDMPWVDYLALLRGFVETWVPVLLEGRFFIVNMGVARDEGKYRTAHLAQMLESAALTFFRNISWIKNAGYLETGFGLTVQHPHARSYYPNISHEDILVYLKGSKPSRTLEPLPHEIFDLYKDDVWRFPDHGPGQPHPAVFPMSLPRTCIVGWTARNEVVGDPFTGSGTTLLACEQTGRRAIAFDLDPLYVALTILRWEAYTGRSATPE